MSIFHYPGMVLTLLALAFLGGMIACSLRLPHAFWGFILASTRQSRRLAGRLGQVARQVLTATRRRARGAARPLARPLSRGTFPLPPWNCRPRFAILIADPIARRVRADQLRAALADLLSARARPLPTALTVEIASAARRDGIAYVAYLDRLPAPGAARIRLASSAPDGRAIGVDMQHTHLADLLPFLDDNPDATFVGFLAADPSSPVVGGPPMPTRPAARRPEAVRRGAAIAGPPPTAAPVPPPTVGGGPPEGADPDIPYGDHDAPAA